MTRFQVFGGGWVQITTFLGFFSFHDFLFLWVYMQAYIYGMKKLTKHLEISHAIPLISHPFASCFSITFIFS